MFSKAVATLAVLFAANIAAAQTCSRSYTVQPGDTCDSISAANNASTYQLAVANWPSINDDCTNLQPNSTICLGDVGEDCQTTYVVKQGDTCDDISAAAAINETILVLNNPQIDAGCSNLYVGEVLCVACTVMVPPAPGGSSTPANVQPPPDATPAIDDLPWCE
ncbi:carbohydrate-binding module family 50 protein [Scleroderma yunnanense]